jgi:probable rRNA maturation factor
MTLMSATQGPDPADSAAPTPQSVVLDLQDARPDVAAPSALPARADLERWATAALEAGLAQRSRNIPRPAELTLRIADAAESAELNQRYRKRPGPTNILSFPFEPPTEVDLSDPQAAPIAAFLGDLVVCAPLVAHEAKAQHKTETAHWAHLVVHGVLHLLGFDHLGATEAAQMEALETRILEALGFPSPYEVDDDVHDE